MHLLPTFNFKGIILPIVDKNDKLYLFIKNECNYRILLNIVNVDTNKFVDINSNSIKIISCGVFKNGISTQIFYMGHELFAFSTDELNKDILLMYSNYIIKNNIDIDRVSFSLSFLDGCKITAFSNKPQHLYIKFVDKNSNKIILEDNFVSGEPYKLNKEYYINYEISIFNSNGQKIYKYNLDLKNKKIWIKLDSRALGDTLAWIPYVEEFRKKHECEIICTTFWNNIFIKVYPNITFISPSACIDTNNIFAIYKIQCSIPYKTSESPVDYRDVSLQEIASRSLGLPHKEIKPLIHSEDDKPLVNEKYAVISTMSTSKAKLWNKKNGWQNIIDYLNSKNIKVVLLQREPDDKLKNIINMSGENDISKSINIIKNSLFFIGLSSGLSWLSWTLHKKTIMISGFTDPKNEFKNEYRIINKSVCNSCWNDKKYTFERKDWFWCPRHKNFECTSEITPEIVINKINQILTEINI